MSANVRYVDTNEALALAMRQLTADAVASADDAGAVVALDTEFIRTRTFFPIAALYQLASANEVVLVDPLPIDDWRPFIEVLRDASLLKLMHSCSEDLDVFGSHLDTLPAPLFDTQVAAGFLGAGYSPGYAELVRLCVGVELGKHQTRSDWLARPLSDEQLKYAIEDVRHLAAIHGAQRAELIRLGRLGWFEAECAERCRPNGVPEDEYYLNVRAAWRCEGVQIARLKALCAWREQRARARDMPRGHVVTDDELVELALLNDLDLGPVRARLSPPAARRYASDLLALMQAADRNPDLPVAPPRPLSRAQSKRVKELKAAGVDVARRYSLAPELLSRRRDLETCVRAYEAGGTLPSGFLGWRYPLVGAAFESILAASDDNGGP
jgi:ribonuclease D